MGESPVVSFHEFFSNKYSRMFRNFFEIYVVIAVLIPLLLATCFAGCNGMIDVACSRSRRLMPVDS